MCESFSSTTVSTTLAEFTTPGLIVPRLSGRDAASVIQELCQAMQRERRIPDLLPFYQAALNQEFLERSDWESGMAFPHARLPALKEVSFALGRSDEPVTWGGKANGSVRLVFLIAVPATDSTQYLGLISGLARLAKEERLVAELHAASDSYQILEVLKQIELRTPPPSDLRKRAVV